LDTWDIARQALERNGYILLVETLAQAVEFSNLKHRSTWSCKLKTRDSISRRLKIMGRFLLELCSRGIGGLQFRVESHVTDRGARGIPGFVDTGFCKLQTTLRTNQEGIAK